MQLTDHDEYVKALKEFGIFHVGPCFSAKLLDMLGIQGNSEEFKEVGAEKVAATSNQQGSSGCRPTQKSLRTYVEWELDCDLKGSQVFGYENVDRALFITP